MSERQLTRVRASRVSTMLQGATRNLLHYATARQNLRFSRSASNDPDRTLGDAELLRRVGLKVKADQVVSSMSGSERQRLALACSVTSAPQLLLADEPTSQLSHEDRDHMLELIHGLGNDFGTTILVVTHQPEVAGTFPRTVTMRGGRLLGAVLKIDPAGSGRDPKDVFGAVFVRSLRDWRRRTRLRLREASHGVLRSCRRCI